MIFDLIIRSQIKQMSMKKSNTSKALYKFTKKQKLKDSTSTKDIDDSLQLQQPTSQNTIQLINKKPHQRTQSCPFIAHPNQLQNTPKSKVDKTQRSQKDVTVRSTGNKVKNSHRHCHSQGELQTISNGQSVSIQNLSAVLYRKNGKFGLKKVGALNSKRCKQFFIHNDHYSKNQIDQQIKTYELNQELKDLQQKSKGITIKQQILYDLISKFEEDLSPVN